MAVVEEGYNFEVLQKISWWRGSSMDKKKKGEMEEVEDTEPCVALVHW